MAGLKAEQIPAPDRGLNVAFAPRALRRGEASQFENLLAREPGKAIMRGPLGTQKWDLFGATVSLPKGFWVNGRDVLVGDGAAVRQTSTGSHAVSSTGSPIAGLSDLRSGHAQLGANVWGTVFTTLSATKLMKWTTAPTYTILANGPTEFQDVISWQNRLIVLGGVPAGGGTLSANSLYWSDLNGPTADTVANWQDDVTGLTNFLTFDNSETLTALARCGRSIAICTFSSMFLLSGNADPRTWTIRRISSSFGCNNLESITEAADGFYFLCDKGYCYTDGSSFEVLSDPVSPYMYDNVTSGTRPVRSASMLDGDYIMIAPADSSIPTLLLNSKNHTWSTFSSAAATMSNGVIAVVRAENHVAVFDGRYFWPADQVTLPERSSNLGRDYDGSTFTDILPVWASSLIDLNGPIDRAQLHRVVTDYAFTPESAASGISGWTVSLLDGADNLIAPSWNTPAQATTTPIIRLRDVHDVFVEANELKVKMDWSTHPSANELLAAEIHDVYIEYQPTSPTTSVTG